MHVPPNIYRLRVVLKAIRGVRLHPYQAGLVYAVVAEANGLAQQMPAALPDGVLVEAVEQCRLRVAAHQAYAFGLTLLADNSLEAGKRCQLLRRGLISLGQAEPQGGAVFRGNFSLVEIHDLVAGRDLYDDSLPIRIPVEEIVGEIERLREHSRLTLRFSSPLRMSRTKHGLAGKKPLYYDRRVFDSVVFYRRVLGRVTRVGCVPPRAPRVSGGPQLVENHLVWLDVAYGGGQDQTRLGGAIGDVVLEGLSFEEIETLVWGQYVCVGENTRFGHGRYRIAQLGNDPYLCPRSIPLRELALGREFLDQAGERYHLEPGRTGELVRSIRAGTYRPQPAAFVTIGEADRQRRLSIPHREDRVLQRAVHDLIAPAIDIFFEPASLAYRPGRGRHQAPPQLQKAFADGYRWAVRADFSDFFNSVDHSELQRRLQAYVGDAELVSLLMLWVRSAAPAPDRGLPTGAVISPLLANVFLDEFDEAMAQAKGRLIRYADDFVILFRDQAQADAMFSKAEELAEELRLGLNDQKTSVIDMQEPFEFLGFRFEIHEGWRKSAVSTPQPVDQLGWRETTSSSRLPASGIVLPGETLEQSTCPRTVVLVGPGWDWLTVQGDNLRFGARNSEPISSPIDFDRVEHLVVAGYPDIERPLLRRLAREGRSLVITSDSFADDLWVMVEELEDPELVRKQVACQDDVPWRLEISTWLVVVKLMNYAALASVAPTRKGSDTVTEQLHELAHKAGRCQSIEQLIGFEGAGAAIWYQSFGQRVAPRFVFPGRCAPNATDPLNVLLNLGYTALHRWFILLLRQQGFAPSLGFLHRLKRGHATLASDLQEPFRHLVDRSIPFIPFEHPGSGETQT